MLDIIKIAAVIVAVALAADIFRLIGDKVMNKLTTKRLKLLFILFIAVFVLSVAASLYSLIKYQTVEWKSFLLVLVSYISLRNLKKRV